ncbi:MAG: acyltransferase [Clostridia bacterium]|nr:acyltransferase [Clostridia bacterium]
MKDLKTTEKPNIGRNPELDLWRLFGSICIVLYHSKSFFDPPLFSSGYALTVEFFFLLSGYFFASTVYRDRRAFRWETIGKETVRFLAHKIWGFLFYFVFGFVTAWIACYCVRGWNDAFSPLNLYELFLLSETGIPRINVMNPDWYLSAMLIVMFPLYPLFRRRKDLFSAVIAPVLGVGSIGYIYVKYGNYLADASGDFPAKSLIRALAGICLGVVVYRASEYLKTLKIGSRGEAALTVVGALSMVAAVRLMGYRDNTAVPLQFLLFMIFITISTGGKSLFARRLPQKPMKLAAEFSLSLYLTHTTVRLVLLGLAEKFPSFGEMFSSGENAWKGLLIYLAASIFFALLAMPVSRGLKKLAAKGVGRIRGMREEQ